jgi:uncharacterized membrane protein
MAVQLLVFVHLFGMALWLGSMFTMGIWTSRARATGDWKIIAFTYSAARRLYQRLVAVPAVVTVASGAILMFLTDRPWFRPFPEHWVFQMQLVGSIVLLVTLLYIVPNAGVLAKLAESSVETGEAAPEFSARVKRQAIVGSLVGLALAYLVLLGAYQF